MPELSSLVLILILVLALVWLTRTDGVRGRSGCLVVDDTEHRAWHIVVARSWVHRRIGLLNHASLADSTGLWLRGRSAVHTHGMLFPIDIVFVSAEGRILAIHRDVSPGILRIAPPRGSRATLELPAGASQGLDLCVGRRIAVKAIDVV